MQRSRNPLGPACAQLVLHPVRPLVYPAVRGTDGGAVVNALLGRTCGAAAAAFIAWLLTLPSPAHALTLERVGGTFVSPTYVTSDPSDLDRLFVIERRGTIQLVTPSGTSTFLDIQD